MVVLGRIGHDAFVYPGPHVADPVVHQARIGSRNGQGGRKRHGECHGQDGKNLPHSHDAFLKGWVEERMGKLGNAGSLCHPTDALTIMIGGRA